MKPASSRAAVRALLFLFTSTCFAATTFVSAAALAADDPAWLQRPSAPETVASPQPSSPAPAPPTPPTFPRLPERGPLLEADAERSTVTAQCTLLHNGDVRCEKTPFSSSFKRTEIERTWYGWQTILTDSAALGMAGSAPFTKSVGTAMGSLGVYMLMPPLVHLLHGHGGRAERSLGMRIGLPAAGALFLPLAVIAYGSRSSSARICSSDKDCGVELLTLAGIGAVSGLVGAMVWDAMTAFDEHKVERQVTRRVSRVSWGPTVAVEPGGGRVAIAGSF